MKSKARVSSQVLVLVLATLVIIFMVQVAQAQNGSSQILQTNMPQRGLGRRIFESTTLTYYQQFLGPTFSGPSSETYNVFQEGLNQPGTGRAPLQSFHTANLRYQINSDWAIGASLAAVYGYTRPVTNEHKDGNVTNRPNNEYFNARAYVALPAYRTFVGTFNTNLAYEGPTSVTSRNDDMTWGLVLSESFTFNVPSPKWTIGILGQYYQAHFNHKSNVKPPPFPGGRPTPLQTVIVSGGPFANYRFNDQWQAGSLITLDWDQRGVQTGSGEFNNNLPHRGRLSLSYFPSRLKYLTNVGVFTQAMLKFRPKTTAVGADFSVRF